MKKINNDIINKEINRLILNSKKAQKKYEKYNQAQVNQVVTAVAWALLKPENNKLLSMLAVKYSGFGNIEDKIKKNYNKTLGLLSDLKDKKTVGIIQSDKDKGITEIAKPIGVIGAFTPSTNPVATPMNNIINALKCRNAIIISPSPKGRFVFIKLLNLIKKELSKIKAPKNLIQTYNNQIKKIDFELAKKLMQKVDLVIVTGNQKNVREAYSSGVPAIGVGKGNATILIDDTINIKNTCKLIKRSKIFDNGTSCSSESNLIIYKSVYKIFLDNLKMEGGYILNYKETKLLEKKFYINNLLNPKIIGKSAEEILKICKIKKNVNYKIYFLVLEKKYFKKNFDYFREKISPILTVQPTKNFKEALKITKKILDFEGKGHSIGIHSKNKNRIKKFGLSNKVCRVIVNQSHALAAGGGITNNLPTTLSLGCGSWGKNSIDNNLNYKNFMNITKIVNPVNKKLNLNLKLFFKQYCKKFDQLSLKNLKI